MTKRKRIYGNLYLPETPPKYTSEPWEADSDGLIYREPTIEVARGDEADPHLGRFKNPADADRAAACVNALAGLEPSAVPGLGAALEKIQSRVGMGCTHDTIRDLARSALAAARGEVARG